MNKAREPGRKTARTGGADEDKEEVEAEERETGRRLGPGHEVEETQVGEQRRREELRRDALGVHRRRPGIHGKQPAPDDCGSPGRSSPQAVDAPSAIAAAVSRRRRGKRPRSRRQARRRGAGGRQHLGVGKRWLFGWLQLLCAGRRMRRRPYVITALRPSVHLRSPGPPQNGPCVQLRSPEPPQDGTS